MIGSEDRLRANDELPMATSAVIWNTVVPALGLALILGASVLPAILIAAAAIAIFTFLASASRRRGSRHRMPARAAARAS